MRPIARRDLTNRTKAFLNNRTQKVVHDNDPKAKCESLWKLNKNLAFQEIKRSLIAMSRGRLRCMYCEDSEATSIDHFWPKSAYPAKGFEWSNYLFACSSCNSNFKRAQFPLLVSGAPALIDPTVNDPAEHLVLSFSTGNFVDISPMGKESINVFGLQRQTLVDGRRNAYHVISALLDKYESFNRTSNLNELHGVVLAMKQASFSAVLYFLIRSLDQPMPELLLPPLLIQLIRKHRDFIEALD